MLMTSEAHKRYHAKHDWENRANYSVTCDSCHKEFEVDIRHPNTRFCSSKCRQAGVLKPCPLCGDTMIGENSIQCRSCSGGFKRKLKDEKECKTCKKLFVAYGSAYCSKKCKDNERNICSVCGTEFIVAKKYKQTKCVEHRYKIECKICKEVSYVKNIKAVICGKETCKREVNRLKARVRRATKRASV